MGFLDRLRKALGGGGSQSATSETYWVYARCLRCGEPLKTRVNLRNDPSQSDDEETWIVRKGLVGTGARRCFQTIEVILTFDADKRHVIDQEITGGKFLTEAEYEALLKEHQDA